MLEPDRIPQPARRIKRGNTPKTGGPTMHKAFEFRRMYGKDGKPTETEWSIGPVIVTTAAAVILGLSGHTIWNGIIRLLVAIKGWPAHQ